jgi:Spy/CpxP family protein refolding chaperone
MTSRSRRQVSAAALAAALAVQAVALAAQSTPREQAPLDVTGYWVSIVTEDWHERMVTPRHGDYASLPLSNAG